MCNTPVTPEARCHYFGQNRHHRSDTASSFTAIFGGRTTVNGVGGSTAGRVRCHCRAGGATAVASGGSRAAP